MPRRALQRSDQLPYHVTARANNREPFPLGLDQIWQIISTECLLIEVVYGAEIQALVLMPNHFHLIITVPEFDLGIVMNELMKSVSRTTNFFSGRSGHVFGGSYHGSLITNFRYYGHALKYVYRNPVKAALCPRVEDYPYSTLHGLLGSAPLPFPIHFTRSAMELALPSSEGVLQLNWLNSPFPSEAEELIRSGLRRRVFGQIIDRKTRAPSELLSRLV